jgi:[ribosomal protein S5]-alanine N-acetyltransferase
MILTDRLLLREFEPADWRAVYQWCADPEVMRFMLAGGTWTEEQSRAYVQQAMACVEEQPRMTYAFAIVLRTDGRVIGGCRLSVVSSEPREAVIGFGFARQYWGQGYATETVRALLLFGFGELKLHRIFAEVVSANRASARVLEKVGMRQEGCFRERYLLEGAWWDDLHYAILDHEWRA